MSLSKITSSDTAGKFNEGQDDTPALTTLGMQQLLDAAPKLIIEKFNANVDALNSDFATIAYVDQVTTGIVVGQISKANIEAILTGDITSHTHPKSAIEAVLTGVITSHTHDDSNEIFCDIRGIRYYG